MSATASTLVMLDLIRRPRHAGLDPASMVARAASRQSVPAIGSYCGGLRFATTSRSGSAWGRRRTTHYAPCGLFVQTGTASQLRSAARPSPGQAASPPQKSPLPGPARHAAGVLVFHRRRANIVSANPRAGGLCRAIRRRACDEWFCARREALRQHTHRACLNEAASGCVVSCAMRAQNRSSQVQSAQPTASSRDTARPHADLPARTWSETCASHTPNGFAATRRRGSERHQRPVNRLEN
jgi:hypothetical protein